MGIFDKRKSIPLRDLKSTLRKDVGRIPGTGGRGYKSMEREKIGREVFGTRYGDQISKYDYRSAIRNLESSARKAKTPGERARINDRIRYLKGLGGKRI